MNNCLIKAIQQKLKNHSVKIYLIIPTYKDSIVPHICWKVDGKYKHYTYVGSKPKWYKLLWFKGEVRDFPYDKLEVKLIKIM